MKWNLLRFKTKHPRLYGYSDINCDEQLRDFMNKHQLSADRVKILFYDYDKDIMKILYLSDVLLEEETYSFC